MSGLPGQPSVLPRRRVWMSELAARFPGRRAGFPGWTLDVRVRSALNEHADVVAELFGRVSTELRGGFGPAVDTFVGFFHAVDWKVRLFSLTPCFARLTLGFSPPGSRSRCCNRRRQCARCRLNPTDAVIFHRRPRLDLS